LLQPGILETKAVALGEGQRVGAVMLDDLAHAEPVTHGTFGSLVYSDAAPPLDALLEGTAGITPAALPPLGPDPAEEPPSAPASGTMNRQGDIVEGGAQSRTAASTRRLVRATEQAYGDQTQPGDHQAPSGYVQTAMTPADVRPVRRFVVRFHDA
jgi:hypothetical protein